MSKRLLLAALAVSLFMTGLATAQSAYAGWARQASGTNVYLTSVSFAGTKDGWAVGGRYYTRTGSVIVHTTNGGRRWSRQASGTSRPLLGVDFVDSHYGWAVGGGSWTDPSTGALCYSSVIVHTTDGGRLWHVQKTGSGLAMQLTSVRFVSRGVGWAAGWFGGGNGDGPAGVVLVTRNGGAKWSVAFKCTLSSWGHPYGLTHLAAADARHVWASGIGGSFLRSKDGGASWRSATLPGCSGLYWDGPNEAVAFASTTSGWVVGTRAVGSSWREMICHTSDGGSTWRTQKLLAGYQPVLAAVAAASLSRVWVVGSSGLVMSTSNGGRNWRTWPRPTGNDLTDVVFPRPSQGWAVGAHGTIVHCAS